MYRHMTFLLALATALCVNAIVVAQQITLSLDPATIDAEPGDQVTLQLWARGEGSIPIDGVEVVIEWHPAQLTLIGHSDAQAGHNWWQSGFPAASAYNTSWDDGNALYQCVAALAGDAPQPDLLVTVLTFALAQGAQDTNISMPLNDDAAVASRGENVLAATVGSIIRTGHDSGDGSDPGDNNPVDPPDDDGGQNNGGQDDTGQDDDGQGNDDQNDDGQKDQNDDGQDDEVPADDSPSDDDPGDTVPGDSDDEPGPGEDEEPRRPASVGFFGCGGGAAQAMAFSTCLLLAMGQLNARSRARRRNAQ